MEKYSIPNILAVWGEKRVKPLKHFLTISTKQKFHAICGRSKQGFTQSFIESICLHLFNYIFHDFQNNHVYLPRQRKYVWWFTITTILAKTIFNKLPLHSLQHFTSLAFRTSYSKSCWQISFKAPYKFIKFLFFTYFLDLIIFDKLLIFFDDIVICISGVFSCRIS